VDVERAKAMAMEQGQWTARRRLGII